MIPIKSYQDINSILGIINLNIFTLKKNENLSFDTIFSQYLNNFQNVKQDLFSISKMSIKIIYPCVD